MTTASSAKFANCGLERRKSAAERVVDTILGMLRSGALQPGETLPSETELASAMNVSRPVIREAYRGLQITGILETRQGGRCSITALDPARLAQPFQFLFTLDEQRVEELIDARLVLEQEIARRAAAHIETATLEHLRELVAIGYDLVNDPTAFRTMDSAFHQTLYGLSKNDFLDQTAQTYYGIGGALRKTASELPEVLAKSAMEHDSIVRALAKRDPSAAAEAVATHLLSIKKSTLIAMTGT